MRLPVLRRPILRWLIVALLLAAVAGFAYYFTLRLRGPSATSSPTDVVTKSTDQPSEEPITTYQSNATGKQPKYLRLPSIDTQGFIQKMGVDQRKQVAVPTNIHLAGWFTSSPAPGEPGLSIIDGHLDGVQKPGIFAKLDHLKPHDLFNVELANGEVRQFRVVSVQSVPTDKAAAVLFSQTPGIARQLNLITCGGTFNTASRSYDHRVIVTSEYVLSK